MSNIFRIALVGYRATGKTTVGQYLAELLEWTFIDMDTVLTSQLGTSIAEWVASKDWMAFREEESRLLNHLVSLDNIVVSTGGGIVEKLENRKLLSSAFFVIWLKSHPKEIIKRLSNDVHSATLRPSLTGMGTIQEVETVLGLREPLYSSVAHITVETEGKKPYDIADFIFKSLIPRL